jgi:hypothetical protein
LLLLSVVLWVLLLVSLHSQNVHLGRDDDLGANLSSFAHGQLTVTSQSMPAFFIAAFTSPMPENFP